MNGRFYALSIVLILAVTLISCSVDKKPGNVESAEAVAKVLDGTWTEANAAWWGYDGQDATETLQAAINSGAKKLIVPNMGQPWIVRPLQLAGNQELVLEEGVEIVAKRGEYKGRGDCIMTAKEKENITINGYGATLRMWKEDYHSDEYEKAEWRNTLSLRSCNNVRVLGLTLRDSGGDGIYVGVMGEQPYCRNVYIKDVICDNHNRQGISVISCDSLLIENCVFSNTWGTAPMAGIDLEPNDESECLTNCIIRNCRFENNHGYGIQTYTRPLSSKSPDIDIVFENCTVTSEKGSGIYIGAVCEDGPGGRIELKNCAIENVARTGLMIRDKAASGTRAIFRNCIWRNVGYNLDSENIISPFVISLRKDRGVDTVGGVEFIDCMLEDNRDRAFMASELAEPGQRIADIAGTLTLDNPHDVGMDLGNNVSEINLKVRRKTE